MKPLTGTYKTDNRFKCQPYRHVWAIENHDLETGLLPGKVCQCLEMIVVEVRCSYCTHVKRKMVKVNSKEHRQWQNIER